MEKISIIIPVFNAAEHVAECVESVLRQTYSRLEIILVDDGSQDDSLRICQEWSTKDERVRVISKGNTGVSDARNVGIESCTGEFLCFVDADDLLARDYLTILHSILRADAELGAVFCNFYLRYGQRLLKKHPRLPSGIYEVQNLKGKLLDDGTLSGMLFSSVCMGLYRAHIIHRHKIRFDRQLSRNEDGVFNIEYLLRVDRIKVISDQYLYIYRQTTSTSLAPRSMKVFDKATERAILVLSSQEPEIDLSPQIAARRVSVAFWCLLAICTQEGSGFRRRLRALSAILNDGRLAESYHFLNRNQIGAYKRLYLMLMRQRLSVIILLLTAYVYPVLQRYLVR